MARALISVSPDGFTYLTLNGATSRYSDAGEALAHVGDYARETATPTSVTINDGSKDVEILVDDAGKVSTTPSGRIPQVPEAVATDVETHDTSATRASTTSAVKVAVPTPEADEAPTQDRGQGQGTVEDPANGQVELTSGELYPQGTPFSGPVTGPTPKVQQPRRRRNHDKNPTQRLRKVTVPGLVLIGLVILMIGAFVIPNLVPIDTTDSPQTINSNDQPNPRSEVTVSKSDGVVPSFDSTPSWEAKIPASASVTASDRGVLVADSGKLSILDPSTGEVRFSEDAAQAPTFAVDTLIAGRPAILWQVGNTAEALFDGESTPREYDLPPNSRISSAGTSVLIKTGNKLSTFGSEGIIDIPTPESGSTPMAVENNELYSADFDGPVVATNIESKEKKSIQLESPGEGLKAIKWISAGHGKVITLWGEQGASPSSGHRIQLVVHSLDNGAILSTVSTTTDAVGEMSWVRGQGGQRAYIGPYLFDMDTGLLLMDTSRDDIRLAEPRGTIIPCTLNSDSSCLLAGKTAYLSNTNLLAMINDGNTAIVDGGDSIRAYDKKPSATQN